MSARNYSVRGVLRRMQRFWRVSRLLGPVLSWSCWRSFTQKAPTLAAEAVCRFNISMSKVIAFE